MASPVNTAAIDVHYPFANIASPSRDLQESDSQNDFVNLPRKDSGLSPGLWIAEALPFESAKKAVEHVVELLANVYLIADGQSDR